jgi:hypothetical protein
MEEGLSEEEKEILETAIKHSGRYLYQEGTGKREICNKLVWNGYAKHIPSRSTVAPGITLTTKGINYESEEKS